MALKRRLTGALCMAAAMLLQSGCISGPGVPGGEPGPVLDWQITPEPAQTVIHFPLDYDE